MVTPASAAELGNASLLSVMPHDSTLSRSIHATLAVNYNWWVCC